MLAPRLLCTLALLGVTPLAAQAQKADLLDRAVAKWAKVKTARATFEQTIDNSLVGNRLVSTGEFQQQRPGKLSVKFDNPATDRIVADGRHVWLYLPSSAPGQVIRSAQGSDGSGSMDVTSQFLTAPRSRYLVRDIGARVVGGRPVHGFSLSPRPGSRAPFTAAAVYIDDADATIRQFEVTEANGVTRTVRLVSLRTNVPVDAAAFVFTPPAGVRVMDR